jgi:hypothetical protein
MNTDYSMLHIRLVSMIAGNPDARCLRTQLETPTESGPGTYCDTGMKKGRAFSVRTESLPVQDMCGHLRDADDMDWPLAT